MPVKKILGHLIDCRRATRLVSLMQEKPLGPVDRVLLRLHLAWCAACARFDGQLRFLREAMQRYRG
jgi:hypothetical protein